METRTAPRIGGRYRINGLLGEGGMARVFDAFDEWLERPVAVKILRAETRELPGMRARFQQEALIAARLLHPHIVAVLDFGEDRASSYLVMERLPGSTLRDEIIARGPLPPGRVLLVLHETLAALQAAHGRGVLHRDIKPSNILLEPDGHTKITDFGIAKSFAAFADPSPLSDATVTGVVLGTPGYLAPERRAAHPATVQSDLYSVGAVLVEALTGQRLAQELAPPRLPPPFEEIARRALAPDPRDRYASAADMLQALQPTRSGTTAVLATRQPVARTAVLHAPPGQSRQGRVRHRGRRVAAIAAGLVALASLAGGAVVLFAKDTPATPPAKAAVVRPQRGPQTRAVTRPSTSATTTTTTTDAEASAISSLATSVAAAGLPGDGALAGALQATAAEPAGAERESAAQQTLALAGVLLDGGGISSDQYQDVAAALEPTGATTTTTTTDTVPVPAQTPPFGGPRHGHGHVGSQG